LLHSKTIRKYSYTPNTLSDEPLHRSNDEEEDRC